MLVYVDFFLDYCWYLDTDDMEKADEIIEMVDDIAAFNIAYGAVQSQATVEGISTYSFVVRLRTDFMAVKDDLDYALMLEYCRLWDDKKFDEASDLLIEYYPSRLLEFLANSNPEKLLVPQLSVIRP